MVALPSYQYSHKNIKQRPSLWQKALGAGWFSVNARQYLIHNNYAPHGQQGQRKCPELWFHAIDSDLF